MIINERYLFDQQIRNNENVEFISGSDEVGRGAMAGPIVVASLILKPSYNNVLIRDSKLLSSKQRENLYNEIIENSIDCSIKEYDAKIVDKLNPKATSVLGMLESIKDLKIKPDVCLIDGEDIQLSGYKTYKVIKGDNLSQTIAAASIIAKVYRDRLMEGFDTIYPMYNFKKHKGYCTKEHIQRLEEYGVLDIHRISYKPVANIKEKKNEVRQK